MLATLNIAMWTARKHDKRVSAEVETAHAARGDAGRYNKLLVDKAALAPIEQIAGAARQEHYRRTLAWGNNNERLLPGSTFMDYTQTMKQFRSEFEQRVQALVNDYPRLRQEARQRLGTMYDPADYPDEIASRFGFNISFMPVPSADDFRVNLNADAMEQIKTEATRAIEERVRDGVRQVY